MQLAGVRNNIVEDRSVCQKSPSLLSVMNVRFYDNWVIPISP